MKFRDYFNIKQILFAVFIIALMLVFAYCSAETVVEVDFNDTRLLVTSDKFSMTIPYDEILSAELAPTPTEDEALGGKDNTITHFGTWKNAVWGEYTACIDMSSDQCIVLKLTDGQTYVFSRKSGKVTEEIYQELLTHIG